MRNAIIIVGLSLCLYRSAFSQEIPIINTQAESCYQFYNPIQEARNELKIQGYLRSRGSRRTINGEVIRYYAIKPFLVKDRTSNDTILTMVDLEKSLDRVNMVFAEINIQFYYLEPVLVDDNRLFNYNRTNEDVVASGRELSNTVNLFVTNSVTIEGGASVNGYAYFPGGPERIFMSKDGILSVSTFTHELGHFFRLYHTHGKSNFGTTDELVDGSNCTVAGDDVCDTPADPNLLQKTNWACVYNENLRDINGDLYNPDVQNIMSYSGSSCRTRFTQGQLERMNLASKALRTNLDGFESSSLVAAFTISQRRVDPGESVSFVSLSDNAVSAKWFFEKGSKTEGSELNEEVIYDQPGTFDVALKVTDALGNTDSVYYENAIKVLGKPDLAFGEIPLIISNRQATSSNDIITEDDKIFVDPSYFNFAGEFEGRVSGRLDFSNGQWYTFSNTGLIEYEAKFEREDLEFNNPGKGKYQFTFKLDFENELDEFNEENNTYTQELTIYGSEPEINITSAQLNENPNQDQLVTTIQVTDAESTAFDYRIITGNDNNAFSINESTGELLVNDPSQFDFEANSQFDLTIQAYTSEITADFDFIVSLNDINEVPSDILISSNSIAENSSVNTIIGQLSAIDQDSGDSFTFSLTTADENNDNGFFRINGNNLEANAEFNFEERSSYSVRIKVEDSGELSFEKLVEVKVTNVNEAPEIAIIISDVTKPEDSDEFILVKDFLSFFSDPDEGDLLSLASVSTNASNDVTFRVEGDDIYATVTKDWFGAGLVLLIVKDQEGLSMNNSFHLNISPINDPPVVSLGAEELFLEKNFVGEEEVSIYMQQPSNEFWLETVTYTTNPTSLDFIDFRIEDQKIIFTAKPDQVGQIRDLEIIADDGQGVNNIGKATISISVEDFTGPSDIKVSSNTINENSVVGALIGELTATDPTDEETFEFTLVSGENSVDNEYFQIVNDELLVNSNFDFETKSSYTINVQVEDSDGNTYGEYLSINVLDVNEPPTISRVIQNVSVLEDAERFTVITDLSDYFMDVDAGDELTFGYAHSEDENVTLSIDGNNLIAELAPDFFGVDYITLSVQDKGSLEVNQQFELTVEAVNDPPVVTLDRTDLQFVKNFEGQEVINISVQQPANESEQNVVLSLNPTDLDFINAEIVGDQLILTSKADQIGAITGLEIKANDGAFLYNSGSARLDVSVFENIETAITGDDWYQFGNTIDGLSSSDLFGSAIRLSSDGQGIIVGSPSNGRDSEKAGNTRVFFNSGSSWIQKGQTIFGEAMPDRFGTTVGISSSGDTIVIGNPYDDSFKTDSGAAKIFYYNNGWEQIGSTIKGNQFGSRLGSSIALNSKGNIVAIGIPGQPSSDNPFNRTGSVEVYKLNSDLEWDTYGNSIEGISGEGSIGESVIINNNGDRLAVLTAVAMDDFGNNATIVKTYEYNGVNWQQFGDDIISKGLGYGEHSVSFSAKGDRLAIGSRNGFGEVMVYEEFEENWRDLGQSLKGESSTSNFGYSVELNAKGDILIVGSQGSSVAKVYRLEDETWSQLGDKIEGNAFGDFAFPVSISEKGSTIALGSPRENTLTGAVSVFKLNFKPTTTNPEISGQLKVKQIIEVSYNYSDQDNDQENGTLFQWYRLNSESGNDEAIEAATSRTYTLTNADVGLQMSVEVTPFDGKSYGAKQKSVFYGPVKANQLITFGSLSTKQYGDGSFDLTASADSDLEIIYSSSDPSVATIEGIQLTIVGAGSTEITASQLGNDIYFEAEDVSQTLVISPATLTALAEDKSKTYGETNPEFTITYDGFVNGDDVTFVTEPTVETIANATSDVGNYDITLTGGSATNYIITNINGILTINKRPITVAADAKSKVYGEDDPALTYQITSGSLVNSDAITGALSRTTGEDVNDYAINQNTLTAGSNYDLTYISNDLTISKATLTATAEDKSKTYGEANPTLTISYSGFVNGDDETAITEPSISTIAGKTSIVGDYNITLTGGSSDNYDLSILDGVLTVTKAPLSVTVQDETINKGDAIPEFSISYNGFVNSEDESVLTTTPTAGTSANSTSDRGTYTIELSDGSAVNYTVNTVDGTLTVTGPVYTLPSTISFTDPVVLGDTETETIVLDNTGDGALNVTGIAVPSGYGINQTSLSVSNGSNTTLTLTFTPTAAQTYAGDIIITSNNGEDIITVTGEGQIVTGIDDDRLDLSEVKVYPNPSDKWLTIDLSDSPSTQANLMLLDPQGKTAWQKEEVSDREIRVNTSTFSSGFYLLIVQTDKGSIIKKVMVQH